MTQRDIDEQRLRDMHRCLVDLDAAFAAGVGEVATTQRVEHWRSQLSAVREDMAGALAASQTVQGAE